MRTGSIRLRRDMGKSERLTNDPAIRSFLIGSDAESVDQSPRSCVIFSGLSAAGKRTRENESSLLGRRCISADSLNRAREGTASTSGTHPGGQKRPSPSIDKVVSRFICVKETGSVQLVGGLSASNSTRAIAACLFRFSSLKSGAENNWS